MSDCYYFRGRDILLDKDVALPTSVTLSGVEAAAVHTDVVSGRTAVELPKGFTAPDGMEFVPLRACFASWSPDDAAAAARLKGLVNWRAATRFCSACGSPLEPKSDENALVCPSCGRVHFPRLEPCVIAVIEKDDDILLLRHVQRNQDIWCCLAGFVEAGESLERALVREVREETGLEISNIRYAGSQSWPFPDQLMVGFHAEYAGGELVLQEDEIMEAGWFKRSALPPHPAPGSISWNLIHYEEIK